MQYGLMCYGYTINLGNEIQSIAARRCLPKIDFYVDHEKLHLFKNSQKIKMIMNGWYLDCIESWPPSDDIDPLLISMHFNTSVNETKDEYLDLGIQQRLATSDCYAIQDAFPIFKEIEKVLLIK